jgi:hypothetical protein
MTNITLVLCITAGLPQVEHLLCGILAAFLVGGETGVSVDPGDEPVEHSFGLSTFEEQARCWGEETYL